MSYRRRILSVSAPERDTYANTATFNAGVAVAANAALPGTTMGLDAPFGSAVLRVINQNTGSGVQLVAPNGAVDVYAGGNNTASVDSARLKALNILSVASGHAPSTSSSSGVAGDIAWDGSFVYVCTAANTWKRSALSTF